MNRSNLKDIVKKAERNGYVTIESADQPRTYAVKLTDLGRELAEKMCIRDRCTRPQSTAMPVWSPMTATWI